VLTVQVFSLLFGRCTHYYHYHNTIISFMIVLSTLFHAANSNLYMGDDPFEYLPRLEYLGLSFVIFFSPCRPGLANVWHVCPKWHSEYFPWNTAFTAVPTFNFFYQNSVSTLSQYVYINKYIHIYACIETVHKLPLLSKSIGCVTFLHEPGTVRSVDWAFIIGAPVWRWLGEYVTLDKTF
jgi:hypothetical protein